MAKQEFVIVDVFAENKYSGNQLAVFRNAGALSGDEMQKIAGETNFSETTFILSDAERAGGYDVRIFTPASEIPFAGHPTLGTAFVIRQEIIRHAVAQVVLNLEVGKIPVTFGEEGILWMEQVEPQFGGRLERDRLAIVLGLDEGDFDARFPVQEVSTGLPHIIVPLKGMAALKKIRVSRDEYYRLIEETWAKAILTFCPGGYTERQSLGVRMFADFYGVAEDPATGSGNGCLAAYLVKQCYLGEDRVDICAGQGYEIGRPSTLYLSAGQKDDSIEVFVGGKVIKVAEGVFL